MIWQLTREQLRSQKRYIAWTGAMLIATMLLTSYSAVMNVTDHANQRDIGAVTGRIADHHLYVYAVDGPTPDAGTKVASATASWADVNTAVGDAMTAGSDLVADRQTGAYLPGMDWSSSGIIAVTGDVNWDALLVEGTAPTAGKLAISTALAGLLGVGVGDMVVTSGELDPLAGTGKPNSARATIKGDGAGQLAFTISGLTRSPARQDSSSAMLPEAYATWEDALGLITLTAQVDGASLQGIGAVTNLYWNTGGESLSSLGVQEQQELTNFGSYGLQSGFFTVLASALALGAIVMSIAIGRNQARARTTWVGTARAMGARRRTIALATLVEALVVGVAAAAVGIGGGILAASVHQALLRGSAPDAFYPSSPVVTAPLVAWLVCLAVVLSVIIGAVPAFWASRIEPIAALKSIEASRTEPTLNARREKAVTYAWIASAIGFVLAQVFATRLHDKGILSTLTAISTLGLTAIMAYRLLRWTMRRVGLRLSLSARAWSIAAGGTMADRPQQSAVVALIFAVILAPMTLITPVLLTQPDASVFDSEVQGLAQAYWGVAFVLFLIAMPIATIIGVAAFATDTQSSRIDGAKRAALGMTRRQEQKARFWQLWISTLTGAGAGATIGLAILAVWAIGALLAGSGDLDGISFGSLVPAILGLAAVYGIMLVFTAGGAVAYASRTPKGTPVEELAKV